VVPPPPQRFDLAALDPDSPVVKTLTGPAAEAGDANTPGWRRADSGGEVDGVRLLSQETIDLIFHEQLNGVDLVLGVPLR
jgi:hypothetical protein